MLTLGKASEKLVTLHKDKRICSNQEKFRNLATKTLKTTKYKYKAAI